jgi:hypothetical protein
MQYLKGINNHANILLGAIYENRASFFTMEIVLIAKRNLYVVSRVQRQPVPLQLTDVPPQHWKTP